MIRTTRWAVFAFPLVLAAAAAALLLAAGSPGAVIRDDPGSTTSDPAAWRAFSILDTLVARDDVLAVHAAKGATWTCQDAADIPRAKASPERMLLRAGHRYRVWVAGKWQERLAACRVTLHNTIPKTEDWATAVRIMQRFYPGSEGWLMSCSASEGGHGGFVMNTKGSGAGGNLQYMNGTFWTDFNAAVKDLVSRSVKVPKSAWAWESPLGQAVAGSWAYGHARWSGKWTGGGC